MSMKRTLVAAAWIVGSAVPLLAATVVLFGCCVLPFHGVVHKVMPLCEMAVNALRGGDHEEHQTTPAQPKQEPVKRIVAERAEIFRLVATTKTETLASLAPAAHRNFISLGAVRCDQDVGLHVFVRTFLI